MFCVTSGLRQLRARELGGRCVPPPSPGEHVMFQEAQLQDGRQTIYDRRSTQSLLHKTTEVLGLRSCNNSNILYPKTSPDHQLHYKREVANESRGRRAFLISGLQERFSGYVGLKMGLLEYAHGKRQALQGGDPNLVGRVCLQGVHQAIWLSQDAYLEQWSPNLSDFASIGETYSGQISLMHAYLFINLVHVLPD